MAVVTHYFTVRGRLTNASALDPNLAATVTSGTVVLDAVVINGKETDLRNLGTAESTLTKTNFKQMLLDAVDLPSFVAAGPTGGTANGTMTGVSVSSQLAVSETWTITSTSATNFTVVGSVTGALADAVLADSTEGTSVAYEAATLDASGRPLVAFTLTQGSVAFNTGAATVFTITVTGNQ